MAADIATELRAYNIASVSLCISAIQTELFTDCGLIEGDKAVRRFIFLRTNHLGGNFLKQDKSNEIMWKKLKKFLRVL